MHRSTEAQMPFRSGVARLAVSLSRLAIGPLRASRAQPAVPRLRGRRTTTLRVSSELHN